MVVEQPVIHYTGWAGAKIVNLRCMVHITVSFLGHFGCLKDMFTSFEVCVSTCRPTLKKCLVTAVISFLHTGHEGIPS